MYAKNIAFPSGFLCTSLLKEKNSIVFYQIFAYVFFLSLENEEKTNETKSR